MNVFEVPTGARARFVGITERGVRYSFVGTATPDVSFRDGMLRRRFTDARWDYPDVRRSELWLGCTNLLDVVLLDQGRRETGDG